MTIIAFNRYWVVRWPWVIINLVVVAILLGLSFWQWQRATEKSNTLTRIATWQAQGAIDLKGLALINSSEQDGVNLDFNARWLAPMVWLVDNQMVDGRIGYDVLIAVEDATTVNSRALLLNLGWVAAPLQREFLPSVHLPQELQVQGIFRTRIKGVLLGTNIENKGVWPMRIQQADTETLSQYLQQPLINGLAYQEKNSPFQIHYRPVILPPERHKAYALQWFLLAMAVVVIALAASSRKHQQGVHP
jgi:cytochrome oxidase assembly protein ShyY1